MRRRRYGIRQMVAEQPQPSVAALQPDRERHRSFRELRDLRERAERVFAPVRPEDGSAQENL
jgi:hypothetical protein